MQNKTSKLNPFKPTIQFIVGILLFLFVGANEVSAANRYSVATGNWNATSTWSATSGGAAGASAPVAADAVFIERGYTVSVTGAEACTSINFTNVIGSSSTISISGSNSLTVSGLITMIRPSTGFVHTIAVGAGSLTTGSLTMSATTTTRNNIISISTGTVTVNGATTTGTTGCQFNFTGSGTLDFKGTITTTPTITTFAGSTVIYSRAGVQTVSATTYSNLILSGSGTKTVATTPTVNGVLSLEGTATVAVTTGVVTYGTNATLQYNTTTGRTTSSEEWITPFAATGGVIIGSTGVITKNVAKVFNASAPLTINSGATLGLSTTSLTLNGNLINNGGTTTGSGAVIITGTATQSIGAFTTTGLVSATKASGTATLTGNVNGAGLTKSGAGTLNLGAALIHTLTGVVTLTAGSLNGGSSTLNVNATSTTAWNGTGSVFTAGTGTVNFGGAAQTLSASASTFYNLTFSGSGTKTLGSITIDTGGTLTSNNLALNFNGNFVNNGTFVGGSSAISVIGTATQSIAGFTTTGIVSMTKTGGIATFMGNVNGAGLTINGTGGTLNLGTALTHTFTGTWTRTNGTLNGGSSILKIGGNVSGTGGTFTPSTGTVDWYANGAQTAAILTYNNLTLSGSGVKTFATTPTVNGVLSLEGTATVAVTTGVVTYGTSATLQYNTTTGRTASSEEWITSFAATGGVIIGSTGAITMNEAKVFNASVPLTINSGATLGLSTFSLTLNGNLINNGGTTTGSGAVIITGTATQSIGAFTTTGLVSATKASGTATLTGNVNGAGLTKSGAGTLNLGAALTHTLTGVVTLTAGSLNGGSSTLNVNATSATAWNGTGSVFTAGTGTVNFGGAAQTLSASATTFNNLSFSGGGVKTLGATTTVNGTLTLTSGLVTLGANNLFLSAASPAVVGAFSATNMIVADGVGALQKGFTAAGSYVFPIGDNTGTAEYSPMTVNFVSGIFASAYVSVKLTNAKHPNASATSYLNRYWTVVQSGISSFSASIEGTYVPADEVGTFANIISARWITPNWVRYAAPSANKIAATSLVAFGDFSGINNLPIITTSATSLTGFTYLEGLGPSTQQSFTVSGIDLFTNITVTPSANFEVSTTSGVSFVATSPITIPVVNGNITTTTIYVRLKAGLPVSTIAAENVTVTSTGAVTKNLACSGTVTDAPLISPTVSTLSGFVYNFGSGPSIAQSFTVNGTNLLANIVLTAPTNYEISLSVGSGYGATLSLTPISGSVSTLIYARLKAGLLISPYVENITLTTTSGITKTVICDGVVNAPNIAVSNFTLAGFIYTVGSGPSGEQTFTVNGDHLTANIVLTAPTNFQISLTSGSGFTSSISLTPVSNTVSTTIIYVRMNAGLSVGIVSPINLTATSTGAITQTVAFSGQIASVATTISSNGTLNGFVYMLGNGPSIQQIFSVSATSLTANVTVTPPSSDYEISLTSGSGFVSSPSTLSITHSGGTVNAVPVYVRLKAGLPVATYNGQNIVLSSTGATNVNVVCNGVIVTGPTILAGPTGLESLCPGASVTLTSTSTGITNQTWTGPNGFYSTAQNPALGVVTAANNGTYTVTGSALSGVNLLTNGDFELGNTGFGSTYIYQMVAPPEKGNYWISTNPQDMYGGFCACTPHSGTKQMIVDGATSIGVVAWSQTVAVTPGQDYQFSYWVQTVFNNANVALLQLYVNGVPIGTATNAPVYGVPWTQFIYNSNSGSNTVVQLTLINKSLQPDGNDFAMDDFVFEQVFPVSSSVNLTVNPTLTPSLAVTASNNPVSEGSEVVFTATPTNGGVAPTYQWYVDGVLQPGATNTTYAYSPADTDNVSCIMTSNYPCASPATATNNVIMDVTPLNNYWMGSIDNDWSVLGNWTAGFIPAPGNDVVYATVANYGFDAVRDLHLDQDRTIGSLINRTARRLVIPAAKGLLVNNVITIVPPVTDPLTGNPTVLTDLIYIYSSPTLANGSLGFHNTVGSPVYASVEMYSKASWDLGQIQGSRYQWQYFGIPLRSIVADPFFYGAYVRKWYETGTTISNHWIQLTNSSTVLPFYGYELCQQNPKTYVFKGALENGNFSSGQLAITSGALFPGQHVFANPYTAAIDIRLLTFGTQTESTVYMYHTGTYNAWTTGGETAPGTSPGYYVAVPKNLAGESSLPRQVPSMGSLLVKAMTVSSNATFDINYNSVIMNNTDPQRVRTNSEVLSDKVSTEIELRGAKSEDKLWLFTDATCTRNFDNGWDGFKVLGSSMSPQLFAMEKDGNYQVNAVGDINDTDLGFQAGTDVEYTLNFTHHNLRTKYAGLYLVDLLENKTVDITESGSQYSFMATTTPTAVKRFKIVTRYYEKNAPDTDSQVKVFSANGTIFIQNLSPSLGDLMLYNISGRCVKRMSFSGNGITAITTGLIPGAYIVRAQTNGEEISKRIIVR